MSRETLEWLNSNTLIGYTDEYGQAWHHRAGSDNHYRQAVPVDDVRHLFDFPVIAAPIRVDAGEVYDADGFVAITNPETHDVYQIATTSYEIHQYEEWLLDEVQALIDVADGDLTIGTAGLLRNGGQAWVQIRPPEGVNIGGDEQLPWILATTSHDGTLATQYKGQRQRVVCDNTLAIGLSERTAEFRIRHTRNSKAKLAEARQALEIIYTQQSEFDIEVERMMNQTITTDQFREVNQLVFPKVEPVVEDGKVTNQRAINNRDRTIDDIEQLWFEDVRVAPFKDTEWGVMQAHNTWFHWGRTYGTGGDEHLLKARQIQSNINGDTAAYDRKVQRTIEQVLTWI